MTLLVEKVALHGAQGLECPFVRVSVYNKDRKLVESAQDVAKFAHRNETCVWYAQDVHLQVPVDNLPEGSFVLLELCDVKAGKKVTGEVVCWSFMRLKVRSTRPDPCVLNYGSLNAHPSSLSLFQDQEIDTSSHSIECFEPPVKLHLGEGIGGKKKPSDELVTATCGGFIGVDVHLTSRREEAIMNKTIAKQRRSVLPQRGSSAGRGPAPMGERRGSGCVSGLVCAPPSKPSCCAGPIGKRLSAIGGGPAGGRGAPPKGVSYQTFCLTFDRARLHTLTQLCSHRSVAVLSARSPSPRD